MADEIIDYYDASMKWLGKASRNKVHQEGLWHKTFQCWVVSFVGDRRELLFQKRHSSKDTFPGMLDKSAAGHLLAGETMEDAVRELQEEIGICVKLEQLTAVGIVPLENISKEWQDREFCHVYVLEHHQPLEHYQVQLEEVSGLFRVELKGYVELVRGLRPSVHAKGLEWDKAGIKHPVTMEASIAHFTPQSEEYYELLFECMRSQGWLHNI